jgi:polyphosphate glucokinase
VQILGIDIGGSGIKGALVDVRKGKLAGRRYRLPTPQPSTPDAIGDTVAAIARRFRWKGPIGCTFPAVVKKGVVYSAANVDKSWIGVNGRKLLEKKTGCPVRLLNDADAAGIAEMTFGAGRGHAGVVFVLTFGTGIGSAIFVEGSLLPNSELGHILCPLCQASAVEAEHHASDRARQEANLTWAEWAERVNQYLALLEALFSPDLFIVGGGVSKLHEEYLSLLHARAEIVPARLRNEAGIVGAALAARALLRKKGTQAR